MIGKELKAKPRISFHVLDLIFREGVLASLQPREEKYLYGNRKRMVSERVHLLSHFSGRH